MGNWQSPPLPNRQSAFTLIELLVVIGIIVLMLGLAVAAFNQITGSRSIAMASNQVSAFLSLARSQAMQGNVAEAGADCGVLFYRDPKTGRTAMTLVWRLPTDPLDLDPLDRYKAWTNGITYVIGDRVVALTRDDQAIGFAAPYQPRILTKTYRCIQGNTAAVGNRPPATGPRPDGLFANAWWEEVIPGNITPVEGFDPQFLPNGVGAQTVNDPRGANRDRYLRTGIVLFDRLGRLDYQTWSISPTGFVGQLAGVAQTTPPPALGINSQLGLVLYDEGKFSADPTHTDGDALFGIPSLTAPNTWADENNEENWLDQNTTLLLVNRANGSLIKGE